MYFPRRFVLVLFLLVITASSTPATESRTATADSHVQNATPLKIDVPRFLDQARSGVAALDLGSEVVTLQLFQREPGLNDAEVFVVEADGHRRDLKLPNPFVFGGQVRGFPDSRVCLTVCHDGTWVRGYLTFGDQWINIQPQREMPDKDGKQPHIWYPTPGYSVAAEQKFQAPARWPWSKQRASIHYLQTKVVGDQLYEEASTTHWYDRMVAHMSYVSDRLEVAMGVRMNVYSYSIRYTLPSTTDSNELIDAFANTYRYAGSPTRHLAHLLTGRSFTDGNLGLSQNHMGRCMGYSLIQTKPDGLFLGGDYQTMLLSLHEIGHNFKAVHELASSYFDMTSPCGWTAYTVMWADFWGNCTAWNFSTANLGVMGDYASLVFRSSTLADGSVTVADGDNYTRIRNVPVSLYISALGGTAPGVGLSNTAGGTPGLIFIPGVKDTVWTLTPGDGPKDVYVVIYGDNDVFSETSESIILDETPPTAVGSLVSASHNVGEVSADDIIIVNWEAATDATSGLAGYSAVWTTDPAIVPDDSIDLAAGATSTSSGTLNDGAWYFVIQAQDNAGSNGPRQRIGPFVIDAVSGADDDLQRAPTQVTVAGAYPNPFNPQTIVSFGLPAPCSVRIDIHNVRGRIVRALRNTDLPAGWQTVSWDGRNDRGEALPSGVYFFRIRALGTEVTQKMALVR